MPGPRVLSVLDTAKIQYYHFQAIIIAGMGLFTDAYDLFCISPIMKLIGALYYDGKENRLGVLPALVVSATIGIPLLGTVVGQLVFGWLGDRIGRRRVYGLALMLMVFSSIGCGFSICKTKICVLTSLSFFRFLLGVGIGGDYPLSATIMSEFANKRTRGSFIAAVFSMQGFGILVGSAVTMIVCTVFDRIPRSPSEPAGPKPPGEADLAWRVILMLGAVPAMLTYYWRMMMPETARYTALVENNIPQAVRDMEKVFDRSLLEIAEESDSRPEPQLAEESDCPPEQPSYGLFSKQFVRQHGRDLFASATAWFLVDVIFYTINLLQSLIYKAEFDKKDRPNAYHAAFHVAELQAIIAIASTIPGYWASVLFIDRVGRVKIQIMGFLIMSICLFVIGGLYDNHWCKKLDVGFYILPGLMFFFSNLSPNTTTFIVPAELFLARFRSTCHGISGAAEKLGAIIGTVGFFWASQSSDKKEITEPYKLEIGMHSSLMILGGVGVIGAVLTYFFTPETKGRSLEDNETHVGPSKVELIRSSSINTSGPIHTVH
ncbi:probable inorganic phosphate transporter 1-9 isoform X2 [Magnolia sinica]|uniref:probable inorganic phosphate transporter 1-9 isoform X2 n=1 Tax=Magnolia sinica TaxID=86752 RepID=UPI002658213D|nr:probable inorganic phosphate transporter 1-9 isoform X2 [Magnolia sinica]